MTPTVLAAAVVTYTDFRGVDGCTIESLWAPNGSRLSCGASAGRRKHLVLRYL